MRGAAETTDVCAMPKHHCIPSLLGLLPGPEYTRAHYPTTAAGQATLKSAGKSYEEGLLNLRSE